MTSTSPVPTSLIVMPWALLALLRVLVGFQPHSGQDDHHGLEGAYGGDFEVQRHWMELTWQRPVGEWYYDEPYYFGLDYPPLTAYVSYVCGFFSEKMVDPHSVAWMTSRGLEDATHKAFMRGTVLLFDLLLFGSAAWTMSKPRRSSNEHDMKSMCVFVFVMIQPALILIDHGHFQYNTFALGLCLWAFHFMSRTGMQNCVLGSILYCLAMSFKQMTLYFAPAVFFYLLGRCMADQRRYFVARFVSLGTSVIATLAVMFAPVIVHGPEGTTALDRLIQVLGRIFPVHRGLFEAKVANIWCVLSLKPFRLRQRIAIRLQPAAAMLLTLLLIVPCATWMFRLGSGFSQRSNYHHHHHHHHHRHDDRTRLLWGVTNSALAFFLASFQVHEKSILLALAPVCLLVNVDSVFVTWFSVLAAWSLWPLLQIDRLQIAYVGSLTIYLSLLSLWRSLCEPERPEKTFFRPNVWVSTLPYLSMAGMLILHMLEMTVTAPKGLPDLYTVLWSVVGCGFLCLAWGVTCWHLHHSQIQSVNDETKVKVS
jgi:alpha-1,3-glucosyltransferase